jgi:SOS-response transcriptional repressor LexA
VTLDRAYEVRPPRPHPVQRQAAIEVTVRESQPIRVEVYDLLGRRVAVPFEQEMPGQQTREVQLDASRLASGTYFVRIRGDSFRVTERMTVVH